MEERAGRLQNDLTETAATIREQFRQEMQQTAERAQVATQDHVEALDTLLKGVTTGGITLRVMGVAFVLLGITLSVAGSLLR